MIFHYARNASLDKKKDEKVITRVNIFIYKMQTRILIRARPHQWFVTIRRRLSPIGCPNSIIKNTETIRDGNLKFINRNMNITDNIVRK